MSQVSEYAILYVDDEPASLKWFERTWWKFFKIFTAASAKEGWELLERNFDQIGVLMSDQRMPEMTGVQLLEKARQAYPLIVRVLVTAHSDMQSTIEAVNQGAIYRYVAKPWEPDDLRVTLFRALEYYQVLRERDQLLHEKLSVLQRIILADRSKNLGVFAAGLSSRFRNTLEAANQFLADAPPRRALDGAPPGKQMAVFRGLDQSIRRASQEIFQLATALREAAPSAPAPLPARDVLRLLEGGPIEIAPPSADLQNATVPAGSDAAAVCRLLCRVVQPAPVGAAATIRLKRSSLRGVPAIEFLIADANPEWSLEQRRQAFAPFAGASPDQGAAGLDLAAAYFLAHHHGGRVFADGTADAKIRLAMPEAALEMDSKLNEGALERLFLYESSWEEYFGARRRS